MEKEIPVVSWCEDIEDGAKKQIENLTKLPFAFSHIAVMPDCHEGYGMPIGTVLATTDAIVPNAVGVDIGCGMCAYNTGNNIKEISSAMLKDIIEEIKQKIPVGKNWHKKTSELTSKYMPIKAKPQFFDSIYYKEYDSAEYQLGTLGGGNHFIELQKDDLGNVWIMIHSGSRNLGKKVADYYNQQAVEMNKAYYSCVPKEWSLAFLPLKTQMAENYITEMRFCLEFARGNRAFMLETILNILKKKGLSYCGDGCISIDIMHNYAKLEHHFNYNVWVHRKGATSARYEEFGIIPGSQGSKSFIVQGKGNPKSFNSCSHGAGRKMSRARARKELDLEKEQSKLDELGVIHGIRTHNHLDEATGAYKDINQVMIAQKDLVNVYAELTPIAVIKG